MKKNTIIGFGVFLSLAFISCKKTSVNEEFKMYSNSPLNGISSNIKSSDVLNWLQHNMNSSTPLQNNIIKKVIENLEFDKMYVERLHKFENIIIIPMRQKYFSQHINSNNSNPLQYLILVENTKGEIRRSDIVMFNPTNTDIKELPKNSFSDFFNNKPITVDGSFILITLGDVKQFEMDFKYGKTTQFRLWHGEKKDRNKSSNISNSQNGPQNCIDWYLVTTYYENGVYVSSYSEYVGTTCNSGTCPPNMQCDEPGDGGGGTTGGDVATVVSRNVDLVVKRELTSYEDWEIKGVFTLDGDSYPNTALNTFSGITYLASGCTKYSFVAGTASPSAPRYSIYSEVSHQLGLLNPTSASGRIDAQMFYPNWLPNPKTDNYGLPRIWQASIELY